MEHQSDKRTPDPEPEVSDLGGGAIFVVTVLLLFTVGAVLFLGSRHLVASAVNNPVFDIFSAKAEIPAFVPTPRSQISLLSLTPTPGPTATPTFTPTFVRIANTGGDGVYLRRTPSAADKLVAWMDGTELEVVGPDAQAEGIVWRHVRDPKGNVGWVPSQYLKAN